MAEKKCLIAISSADCHLCKVSYQFINKINRKLNPKIVLSNVDKASAEYFVKEYLKITDIPWVIDDAAYCELLTKDLSLQIKLFDDSILLFQFPVKELSNKLDLLNSFASINTKKNGDKTIQPFTKNTLTEFNRLISKKFFGQTRRFILGEYLTLHSSLTNWVVFGDLTLNFVDSIHLSDSFLFHITYNAEERKKSEDKRAFYLQEIVNLPEVQINGVAYFKGKLYICFYILDYQLMKSKDELLKSGNEAVLIHNQYLLEIDLSNSIHKVNRLLNLTKEHKSLSADIRFSISENQPALFFKSTSNSNIEYSYILLNKEWTLIPSLQLAKERMAKSFAENLFYNEFCLNYDQNVLIDNSLKQSVKVNNGSLDLGILTGGGLFSYNNKVYINVLYRKEEKHWIYRVDMVNRKVDVIRDYKEANAYQFYPIIYFEQSTNTIFILDINDEKCIYIVDSFKPE
ncbi:MAG: hypothetical protein JNM67_02480 [Bacteroidetes bacterium]|nr:hypothetical protein [Bacteroidota bacterium]